jgi:hypothetical protein
MVMGMPPALSDFSAFLPATRPRLECGAKGLAVVAVSGAHSVIIPLRHAPSGRVLL